MQILKLNDIKLRNLAGALRLFVDHDDLSRREIAQLLDCDKTTSSRVVKELIRRKLLAESGKKIQKEHGRPRKQLQLNPAGPVVIGIALEADAVSGVVADLCGHVRYSKQLSIGPADGCGHYLDTLSGIAEELRGVSGKNLAGASIAGFGTISGYDAVISDNANFQALNNVSLRTFFSATLPVEAEFTDVTVARMHYALQHDPELRKGLTLLVHAGSGIGMALAWQGTVLNDRSRHGGEFGHNCIEPDGLPCRCGRRGCVETRAATGNLLRDAGLNCWAEFQREYENGNPKILKLAEAAEHAFTQALGNQIINILPDHVALSGELFTLGDSFRLHFMKTLSSKLFAASGESLHWHWIRLDGIAGATGCAMAVSGVLLERIGRESDPDNLFCSYSSETAPSKHGFGT